MQITRQLGLEIIQRIEEYISFDINIIDLDGKIVASTDEDRIDQIHDGAIKVIKTGEALILSEENVQSYEGTKPGANLPIMHQGKIEGVIGVSGNPDEILPMTGLIRASVEIVIEQMYVQKQAHYKERQWSFWLQQLLHPSGIHKESLENEAIYYLRIDTESYWQVIVFEGEDVQRYLDDIQQKIAELQIETLFILPFSSNEVIISMPSNMENLDSFMQCMIDLMGLKVKIGIGEEEFGIEGIRYSYRQAKQALLLNTRMGTASYSATWKIERIAHAIHQDEYNSICLSYEKKLEELGEIYTQTIDHYLSMNFSIKRTANLLHIHRNTLLYRLDQIREKVGLDPRSFHDAFLLKIIRSRQV